MLFHLIPFVVGADLLAHPELSGAALAAQILGDLKHAARGALGRAGFLVDVLWNEASFQDTLGKAVQNEISKATAPLDAMAPSMAPPKQVT